MSDTTQISIFIVDDENLARARLKRLISDNKLYQVCGEAENGEQALQLIEAQKPDIVLLDIRMPGIDGLEVAEKLAEFNHPPAIIFCTAYDEYAIEAFKYKAIGYVLKPARSEDLNLALIQAKQLNQLQIKQLRSHSAEESPLFVAHSWHGDELIPFNSIYFFRSDHKYLTVYHTKGESLSDQTLKELERIHPDELIRVHRNTLVNISHISALHKNSEGHYQIRMKDDAHNVTISRRHVAEIKKRLNIRSSKKE